LIRFVGKKMLYNPYRNYDKGMDDAYMGIEPTNEHSQQYMEGYERCQQITDDEEKEELDLSENN
jgi:hypothetical protein